MSKRLAIFSLNCCKGCLTESLDSFPSLNTLHDFFVIKSFSSSDDFPSDNFDIGLVQGNPKNEEQEKFLRKIRKHCNIVIAVGSCAHLGGIQSQCNVMTKKLFGKRAISAVSDFVKADYIIPGCPINQTELFGCLLDLYWGKNFSLPDLPVCFECRNKGEECFLRRQELCLGPITRSGCDSICPSKGIACLGCRGQIAEPNVEKLQEIVQNSINNDKTKDLLSFFGKNLHD